MWVIQMHLCNACNFVLTPAFLKFTFPLQTPSYSPLLLPRYVNSVLLEYPSLHPLASKKYHKFIMLADLLRATLRGLHLGERNQVHELSKRTGATSSPLYMLAFIMKVVVTVSEEVGRLTDIGRVPAYHLCTGPVRPHSPGCEVGREGEEALALLGALCVKFMLLDGWELYIRPHQLRAVVMGTC